MRFDTLVHHRDDRVGLDTESCWEIGDAEAANKDVKYILILEKVDDPNEPYRNADALREIQKFPQVDTLHLPARCLHNNRTWDELRNLILLKQDRPWKIILDFHFAVLTPPYQFGSVLLEFFSLLEYVPYLSLRGWQTQEYFVPILVEKLHCRTASLQELDLRKLHLGPHFLVSLYKRYPNLCKKIPHVVLSLETPQSEDDPVPISFPVFAQQHLRSIEIRVKSRSVLSEALEWIQQACQTLAKLECLVMEFWDMLGSDLPPFLDVLSSWMNSTCCRCAKLSLKLIHADGTIPVDKSQVFYRALGNNRTLQALQIYGAFVFPHWNDVYTYLSHGLNAIHCLSLELDKPSEPRYIDVLPYKSLLNWQIRMRPIRLVTVDYSLCESKRMRDKLRFVSNLHARWRQGRPLEVAMTPFIMSVPRSLWAKALHSIYKTAHDTDVQDVSLDAMYYLLRIWLTTTSEIPCRRVGQEPEHRRRKYCPQRCWKGWNQALA